MYDLNKRYIDNIFLTKLRIDFENPITDVTNLSNGGHIFVIGQALLPTEELVVVDNNPNITCYNIDYCPTKYYDLFDSLIDDDLHSEIIIKKQQTKIITDMIIKSTDKYKMIMDTLSNYSINN